MTLKVELVSPERVLFEGDASMVAARTVGGGDIAFLTGHAPFLGALEIDLVTIRPEDGGGDVRVAVHGGFISVQDDHVVILSDIAELSDHIDVDRAHAAQQRAEEAMKAADQPDEGAALRRARARLKAVGETSATH
jgi:F-type H+-transporting ATPase subunit epsilon